MYKSDASIHSGAVRLLIAPGSMEKEIVCYATTNQSFRSSTTSQVWRSSNQHQPMQLQTRWNWQPLLIPLLLMGVRSTALPVTMTSWSSHRHLITICSSGPSPKDVEIALSTSPFFPWLDISIVFAMCDTANLLPHWLLATSTGWSNCGHRPLLRRRSLERLFQQDSIVFSISLFQSFQWCNFNLWCWFLSMYNFAIEVYVKRFAAPSALNWEIKLGIILHQIPSSLISTVIFYSKHTSYLIIALCIYFSNWEQRRTFTFAYDPSTRRRPKEKTTAAAVEAPTWRRLSTLQKWRKAASITLDCSR